MTKAIEAWVKRNQNHFKDSNEENHLIEFLVNKYGHKNSINFSYVQCVIKAEAWVTKLNENNINQIELGLVETIFEEGPYKVVKLLNQTARNYEGAKMNNCIAKYKDEDDLYSLRNKENKPHCTIEIRNDRVKQIAGTANSPVSSKYASVLMSFFQKNNIKNDVEIIKIIGYFYDEKALKILKKLSPNLKTKFFNNKEYIYISNKLIFVNPLSDEPEDSIQCLMSYLCQTKQNQEELISLVSKRQDIFLKKRSFQDENGDTVEYKSPIHLCLMNQEFEFTKALIKNHVTDYVALFSCLSLFKNALILKDEDFIRYLFSKGFRVDGGHDPGHRLSSPEYYERLQSSVFLEIIYIKDFSIFKDFEQAGFNPLLVPIKYIWLACTSSSLKTDQAKREYLSSLKIPLTDYAVAAIEILNKYDSAAVNLFLSCFGVTLDEVKAKVTPELIESHINNLKWLKWTETDG